MYDFIAKISTRLISFLVCNKACVAATSQVHAMAERTNTMASSICL